ncbi:hypothetical protein [Natronobiforma cellulositropha]|uniref:hypothetical protein n=1 Tax=Natronobiforma cellulositropha TaxID=1679076 RepID=UPI0021D59B4B|nr:hypothetical protein [Natronobiforma cellulositropha]
MVPQTDEARLTEAEVYAVVHAAVKDALLDALGTALLLGFSLAFLWVGTSALLTEPSTAQAGVGIATVALSVVLAAMALDYLPKIRG